MNFFQSIKRRFAFRFNIVMPIMRAAGLGTLTVCYLIFFTLCAFIVSLIESEIGFPDALWVCFQAITTIGFGDIPVSIPLARIFIVLVSVSGITYIAIFTGTIVTYCTEVLKHNAKESISRFITDLEHMDELSPEELKELAKQVKKYQKDL